ncbi:MAG: U32 family peptidase [Streptosporangiaceae bacterium]
MSWIADVLDRLGVTGREPASFPDGAAFRIEIPSVEGPKVLEAVLRAAQAEGVTVNRVSQGSGAVLMRAAELRDMAQAGLEAGVEVCLFVGPRERYGVGAHARSEDGRAHGDQVRGLRQISYALEDVLRATEEGIRSFLVADLGLLRAVTQAQAQGALPAGLVWKVSAAMSPSNPVTVKLLEDLGASTVNIPADMTLAELAEMRAAVSIPLDLYVEAPDPLGGVVRGQELGDLIKTGAPLYAKFGLRNAQGVYPSGHHLEAVACANAIEKVHRAAVALEWLERLSPGLVQSKPGAAGLGVPVLP